MAPLYLLDANVLSEPTKLRSNSLVLEAIAKNHQAIATASVAYHELMFGWLAMSESRRKSEVGYYIRNSVEKILFMFSYCETSASWHARERVRLRKVERTPPFQDGQIAAIASINNLNPSHPQRQRLQKLPRPKRRKLVRAIY